jgi:hypothetical protein
MPDVPGDDLRAKILNHNQLSLILQINSGLPFSIRSSTDLNADGVTNDRPIGVDRNTGRFGNVYNLDARYSRYIPIRGTQRGEIFIEAKNLFNRENVASVNRVIATTTAGVPAVPIPDVFPGTAGYDQRIIQIGFKVAF